MLNHRLMPEQGILIAEPQMPLSAGDFESLSKTVDTYLETHPQLRGMMIHARQFPGWEDFQSFTHHIRFVKDHHKKVEKIAVVSDSKLASLGPALVKHFVNAEIKTFDYDQYDEAFNWLQN